MTLPLTPWVPGSDPVDLDTQMSFKGKALKAYGNVHSTEPSSGPQEVVLAGDCTGPVGNGSEAYSIGSLFPTWDPLADAWTRVYGGQGVFGPAQQRAQAFVPEQDFYPTYLSLRVVKDNTPTNPPQPVFSIKDGLGYYDSNSIASAVFSLVLIPVEPVLQAGDVVDNFVTMAAMWVPTSELPLKAGKTYYIVVRTSTTAWNDATSVSVRTVPNYYDSGGLWTDDYGVWTQDTAHDMEFLLRGVSF